MRSYYEFLQSTKKLFALNHYLRQMRDQRGTVHTSRCQEKRMSNCTWLKSIWQVEIGKTRTIRYESNQELVIVPIQYKISNNGFLGEQN